MTITYDPNQPAFTSALERVQPELDAIPVEKLEPIRHDIGVAVVTILGVASTVKRYREDIRVQIGEQAAHHVDVLEDATRACGAAHSKWLATLGGRDPEQMLAELTQERRVLLAAARTLVARGRMPAHALAELVGGTGQKTACMDVLVLVAAFRGVWADVSSVTSVTTDELARAEALANAVATMLGENEQLGSSVSPTAVQRERAYTFFVRTYAQVRRAIQYVRWREGDADLIAPSLSAGRTRRTADDETDVTPIVPVTSVAPANGAPTGSAAPGMPNSSPFVTPS